MFVELLDIIKNRRSIRKYYKEDIPTEDLYKILEAARWAPSAGNLQPWEFIIIKNDTIKEKIASAAYGQYWITEAPIIIIACTDIYRTASVYGRRGKDLYCIQDVAAAIQNILLMAHYMGYGTCWVGAFNEEEISSILSLPEHVRPLAIIPIGKPREKPAPRKRRPLHDIIHYEKW